ncbi:FecR family protein [Zhouia amylolytica]|uniref:FecR family protein n=1 Tax=Zhouia amylolytica AD3 TaxID=1286632 RepID=W2UIP7_9FLAO|nr:FecR family protein [Zhouia amylolytica]ETN94045.1 hypothetical protein P278_28490 [Zhouia amylolytica AD3]MCQ0112943.1 FecR family protein [Zhouia amylolytica]
MNKKTILKLIKNELPEKKEKEVIAWLFKNPKRQRQYELLKAKHIAQSLSTDPGTSSPKRKPFTKNVYKYAIVLLAIITSSVVYWNYKSDILPIKNSNAKIQIIAEKGEKKEFYLSDSTKVILNSNSSLTYQKHFEGSKRKVILEGEAFFDVTENKEKPFIVYTTSGMKIKVLGTSFNIKSYREDQYIETTLVEGKVKIIEDSTFKTVELNPSQKATYIKTKDQIIIEDVDPHHYTSWRKGKLIYNETPMDQVLKDLERTYDVVFKVQSSKILEHKYNGIFDNLSLNQILELFELSSPITFKINDKTEIEVLMKK